MSPICCVTLNSQKLVGIDGNVKIMFRFVNPLVHRNWNHSSLAIWMAWMQIAGLHLKILANFFNYIVSSSRRCIACYISREIAQ